MLLAHNDTEIIGGSSFACEYGGKRKVKRNVLSFVRIVIRYLKDIQTKILDRQLNPQRSNKFSSDILVEVFEHLRSLKP